MALLARDSPRGIWPPWWKAVSNPANIAPFLTENEKCRNCRCRVWMTEMGVWVECGVVFALDDDGEGRG